jgi:hypothetical protein
MSNGCGHAGLLSQRSDVMRKLINPVDSIDVESKAIAGDASMGIRASRWER